MNSNDLSNTKSIFPSLNEGHEYKLSILRLYTLFERSLKIEGILSLFSNIHLCK